MNSERGEKGEREGGERWRKGREEYDIERRLGVRKMRIRKIGRE